MQSDDVLIGQYAPSVLAACASALSVLKAMRAEFEHYERHMYQRWVIWVHSLIAGVCIELFFLWYIYTILTFT